LPQQGAYETVLRDGMATDALDPVGIYFGTRSGKLYASRDEGKIWKEVLNGLPQIVCVASAVVAELAGPSLPRSTEKRKRASPKKTKAGRNPVSSRNRVSRGTRAAGRKRSGQ
jgi:hypothetical protein